MTAADRLRMLADQMDAMEAGRLPPDLTAELSHLLPPVAAPYAHTAPHFEPGYAPEPRHQLRDRDGPRYRPPDLHPSYRDRDREERPPPSARPTSAVADPDTRKPQRQQLPQAAYVQRQQFRWLLKTRIRQVRNHCTLCRSIPTARVPLADPSRPYRYARRSASCRRRCVRATRR